MEVKLIISADHSALKFAELLGGLIKEGIVIESEEKSEGGAIVGTEPYGTFETQDAKMETAPVDKPEIIEKPNQVVKETTMPVYTAEELRDIAKQIPKNAEKQNEIVRILVSSCAEGAKPAISNILPEHSYQAMVRLKALAGVE